jgi:putative endonuclease
MALERKYLKMLEGMKDAGETCWSVYLVRCSDSSLYTGIAKDVDARLIKHNSGKGAAYTRARRPVVLLYREDGLTRSGALVREAEIKSWPKPRKERLASPAAR